MPRGTQAGALWWAVQARDQGLRSTLRQSANSLRDYERSVKSAQRSMRRAGAQFRAFRNSVLSARGAVGALAGTAGIGLMVKRFAEAADVMTLAQSRLKLVTHGTNELRQAQADLFAIAQQTGSAYEDTVTLYSRLARATEDLGVSQRKMLIFTRAVNQSLIVSGTTAQEARAGMIQLSQALASNRLGGDEFRSVSEQMTRFTRALADGLGVSIGKLRELSHAGKLTAETVLNATIGQAPKIAQEFTQIERTVQRALTELRNQYLQFVAVINQGSGATKELIAAIDQLKQLLADPGFQKAAVESVTALVRSFTFVVKNIEAAKETAIAFGVLLTGRFALQVATAAGALEGLAASSVAARIGLATLTGPHGALVVAAGSLAFYALRVKEVEDATRLLNQALFQLTGRRGGVGLVTSIEQQLAAADSIKGKLAVAREGIKQVTDEIQRSNQILAQGVDDARKGLTLGTDLGDLKKFQGELFQIIKNLGGLPPLEFPVKIKLTPGDLELLGLEPPKISPVAAVAPLPIPEDFLRGYTAELERGLTLARQELELVRASGAERLKLAAQFKIANDFGAQQVQLSHQLEDAQKKLAVASGQQKESAQAAVAAAQANLDALQKTAETTRMLTAMELDRLTIQQQAAKQEAESQALRQAAVDHQQFVDSIVDATRQLQQEAAELTGKAVEKTAEDVLGERERELGRSLRDALKLKDTAAAAAAKENLRLLKDGWEAELKNVQDRLDAEKRVLGIKAKQQALAAAKAFSLPSFDKEVELEFKKLENANRLARLRGKELFEEQQLIKLEAKELALQEILIKAQKEGHDEEIKALEKMLYLVQERLKDSKALTDEQRKRADNLRREKDLAKKYKKEMEERKKLALDISQTLTKGMEDAILGAKSFKEALKGVLDELARILLRAAILKPLEGFLTGAIGGLFGVPGKAAGGSVKAGRPYIVGEGGRPELFVPNVGGEIIPNYKLRPALGGGGGVVVSFGDINIESTDGPGVRAAMAEAIPVIENRLSRLVSGQVQTNLSRPSPLRGIR